MASPTDKCLEAGGSKQVLTKERGNWTNKVEFLLTCFSYAVGLGTIWRFPYLCYRNGGGAFLIAYAIMYIFAGLPLFFFEIAFGQYASEGPIKVWKICPLFSGIGYAMFIISFFIGIYYNMVVAWSFFYLFASWTSELPWSSCDNPWNSQYCRPLNAKDCAVSGGLVNVSGDCIYQNEVSAAEWSALNVSSLHSKSPADEYFHNHVLEISKGIEDLGTVSWRLALCLLLAWVVVGLALFKGIKSVGKAVYFTSLFPYVILTVLLIRAVTLPGYYEGMSFYLTPQWDKLTEASVWGDAAMQIFFSLSPCWGGLITLASYNKFHNDCFRDSVIIATGNVLTAFFAGFVIFGIVGFMALELGLPIDKVATQGAGLAFIAYPEAVSRLPAAPLWSTLFFVMFLTLGLGTQFTVLETVVTTIVDTWPDKLRGQNHKWVLMGSAVTMFLLGLPMCTSAGMYILQLIDSHAATFSALIIGMIEVGVVMWHYGARKFLDDIRAMIGYYPPTFCYWFFVWKYLLPVLISGILIFGWFDYKPLSYGDYTYPGAAIGFGWLISLTSVAAIPIVALIKISRSQGSLEERIRGLMQPCDWDKSDKIVYVKGNAPKHTDSAVPLTTHVFDEDDANELEVVIEDEELEMKPAPKWY